MRIARDARFELFHTDPAHITASMIVRCSRVLAISDLQEFYNLNTCPLEELRVSELDLIFSRADKPYPPSYLENLAEIERVIPAVNSSKSVITAGQRRFLFDQFPGLLEDSILSRDPDQIERFLNTHKRVVAKKNLSYGGKGVYLITLGAPTGQVEITQTKLKELFNNTQQALAWLLQLDAAPFEFIPFRAGIAHGDKRVLVTDGKIIGCYLRRSESESWIHNFTQGAKWYPATLTESEQQVIANTCTTYHQQGIYTLGYDFLAYDAAGSDWRLSEINCGNIGGYGRVEELYGVPVYEQFLDWLFEFPSKFKLSRS